MASVTAIMNEVSGDCGEGIKVPVKFKGGQSYFEVVEEIKSPWGGRGLMD